MKTLPNSRTKDIVVQHLGNETLVYNLATHKAYNLNETSSIVFNHCNGKASFDELKRNYKFTDDLIYLALDKLKENNLIAEYESNHFAGLSRRAVIRKVGLATMIALPVISTLLAPTASQAQSTCATGTGPGGGSGVGQACFCRAGIATSTRCGTGDGSTGAANTFCRAGCTCTSLASPGMLCQQGGACRGTCGA